jgi:microfibrillar-associated protein 1
MTANPVKAPRYRPGKVIAEEYSSESEALESEDEAPQQQQQQQLKPPPKYVSAAGISSSLSKVDLNERRKQAALAEAKRVEAEKAARIKEEEGFVTEEESEEAEETEESEEESGTDEESEQEAPRRVMMRPTFIKKDKRQNAVAVQDTRPDEERVAEEAARRKAAADEIVEEQIRKDIAAKAAGKANWDDDEELGDEVDDTDDLDPEAEYAAWKLRELKRIMRDREAIEAREKELEETERRRGLTEEERKAEDEEFIKRQQEEREGKGKMAYMQKYYHKGAFFQDDAKEVGLDRRDIMGSRFADEVQNRELLPQALQMRDMTKLGRKGATKYRDLKSEDTGRWGQFEDRRRGRGGASFGVDERFRPDETERSGANNLPVGERKRPIATDGPKAVRQGDDRRGGDRDSYRPRSRSPRRDRWERSRSRSPGRDRDYDARSRRKRSSSRDGGRYDYDKRRRVD